MDSKRKEFDIDDQLIFGNQKKELNTDLKELNDYDDLPSLEDNKASMENDTESEDKANDAEKKEYYDTNYWKDPYTSTFKIEDLLLE